MSPPRPRIYADFNGLIDSPRAPGREAVLLDGWGSLRDLSHFGVRLREGMALTVHDASDDVEDLEVHAVAWFDRSAWCWYAEFEHAIAYVPARDRSARPFLCLQCRADLGVDYRYSGECPDCGLSIRAAIASP